MKKQILIVTIIIIIITIAIIIIVIDYNNNDTKIFTQNGVTYALAVDGTSVNNFPSKGMYRVDVECNNATGKWLYDEWKLAIENINGTNAKCDVNFVTIDKTYLNNYIIGLSGSIQGDGQVVDEPNITVGEYTNSFPIAQSDYKDITMFYTTVGGATSGTINYNSYTFSGNSWNSEPSNMTSGAKYHLKFRLSSSGYYQVCFTISRANNNGWLEIYNGKKQLFYISPLATQSINNCVDIGYVNTNDYIDIIQNAYSDNVFPIATITLNFQKATNTQNKDTGIRYEGKNPNNYIWFNGELWRIIGVFDSASHGQSNKNLVKIIRANSIGGLAWHKSNTNDWTQSSLMNLLNDTYLYAKDGTNSGYCFTSSSKSTICDHRLLGIKDSYRNMIANVKWYLGGSPYGTAELFYGYERGTTVYSERPTEWEGKIGLMYASDYGYAVLANSCARTTSLSSYDTSICAGENWLNSERIEWTLTVNPSQKGDTYYTANGSIMSFDVIERRSVRPVLYLDSSVYVIDGNGTMADPYIIGM